MLKYFLIKRTMINIYKYLIFFIITLFALNSCQSVKEGLTGGKKSSSDEFLVEKKNPLVLPPEFEKLPEPTTLENTEKKNNDEDDIKKIITKVESSGEIILRTKTSSGSLEESIIEKIKNN